MYIVKCLILILFICIIQLRFSSIEMPRNLKLVDCFMTILFICMFNFCLTLVRWNTINFVLSILRSSLSQSQSYIKTRVEFISFSISFKL